MVGTGNSDIPRFFYSSPEDACIPFNYSGLGGNENNFLSKIECEVICPGTNMNVLRKMFFTNDFQKFDRLAKL